MSTTALFEFDYRAIVIGASGSIGHAFVAALQADVRCQHVEQVSRSNKVDSDGSCFDLCDAESIAARAAVCASSGPYHLIIDATGALTIDGVGPEKALSSVQAERMANAFAVNAIGPLMVLRHFAPLLATGPAVYAKLSARVGSISDNHKGGWYSYRASKAALNMLLQTAAIELQRKNAQLRVVALQPGTVRSALSKPFSTHVPELLEPEDSVTGMLTALRNLQVRCGAHFVDYRGQEIGW